MLTDYVKLIVIRY